MEFFIGVGRYRLDTSACMSLKEKRRFIRSLLDRLGSSRLMAVSEVGNQDFWKSGCIGLACVSQSHEMVVETLEKARRMIEASGIEVVRLEQWVLRPEDMEA